MPRKGQDRTRLTGRLTLLFSRNAIAKCLSDRFIGGLIGELDASAARSVNDNAQCVGGWAESTMRQDGAKRVNSLS